MKPTLLIMAAGMGSRYGGLKQMEPVSEHGETILDYSVYDAVRAGFGNVVFIIRKEIEAAFRETLGKRYERRIGVDYVFQEMDVGLTGAVAGRRKKPWGTGHAVLCARHKVNLPFAVINADDYYGRQSLEMICDFCRDTMSTEYGMVGYAIENTLSEYGSVSRGLCTCDGNMFLKDIAEGTCMRKKKDGSITFLQNGNERVVGNKEIVSMNLWGFNPSLFSHLESLFARFLAERSFDSQAEFGLPSAIKRLIDSGVARVKVFATPDSWFGLTYREDKPIVARRIKQLIGAGVYPEKLW